MVVVVVAIVVEEAGTIEDRTNGGAGEGVEEEAELEVVGGEEDGVEGEEEQDSHQITKTSDIRMTSITRTTGTLVIDFNKTGLQEAEEVSSATIRGLLAIKIHIKESGGMDQLVLAMTAITSNTKHLSNSVIQGKLRKLSWHLFLNTGYAVHAFMMLFNFYHAMHSAQIRVDMEEWSKSSMWPLSCYAYFKETPCLPGFVDVSPEELRWEAYQAEAGGNSQQYLKSVSQLNDKRLKAMHELSNLTKDDVRDMVSVLPSI